MAGLRAYEHALRRIWSLTSRSHRTSREHAHLTLLLSRPLHWPWTGGRPTEVEKGVLGRSEGCTERRRDRGIPRGTLGRISERVGRILERLGRILAHVERILERLGRILGRIWGCQRDRKASIIEH